MKRINLIIIIGVLFLSIPQSYSQNYGYEKPKISFIFDDGSTKDLPGYKLEEWNQLILNHLGNHDLKAVLFATGSFLEEEKGKYIINSWNNAGHKIANHTYTHPYYHSSRITIQDFKQDFLKNDSVITI